MPVLSQPRRAASASGPVHRPHHLRPGPSRPNPAPDAEARSRREYGPAPRCAGRRGRAQPALPTRSRRLERLQSALQLGCFSRAPCDGRIRSQAPPYIILPSFSSVWRLGSLPPRRHLEGGMASTPMGNEGEKKSSWPSQTAPSLRGGPHSLPRPEAQTPETVPAARHTSCQLLVKRTCLKTTLLPLFNHFRLWGPPGHEQHHPEAFIPKLDSSQDPPASASKDTTRNESALIKRQGVPCSCVVSLG
nr:uncharacterized protein LOC129492651 [Symphalangus syndactylus]